MKIAHNQMKKAIAYTNDMSLDMKCALLALVEDDEKKNTQQIEEGCIVKVKGPNDVLLVVKILDEVNDTFRFYEDTVVVVYDFLSKEIDWQGLNLLSDPKACEIIGKMNPKQIFREDIKL